MILKALLSLMFKHSLNVLISKLLAVFPGAAIFYQVSFEMISRQLISLSARTGGSREGVGDTFSALCACQFSNVSCSPIAAPVTPSRQLTRKGLLCQGAWRCRLGTWMGHSPPSESVTTPVRQLTK